MHLNVEIKARCPDPERVRAILRQHGAEYKGLDHQVDTYFNVPQGRLKLRVSKSIGSVTTCLSQALVMVLIFVVNQNILLPASS